MGKKYVVQPIVLDNIFKERLRLKQWLKNPIRKRLCLGFIPVKFCFKILFLGILTSYTSYSFGISEQKGCCQPLTSAKHKKPWHLAHILTKEQYRSQGSGLGGLDGLCISCHWVIHTLLKNRSLSKLQTPFTT